MAVSKKISAVLTGLSLLLMVLLGFAASTVLAATQSDSGSTGIQGTIPSPPPSKGATIIIPKTGQSFNTLPITVSGLCPNNTLVEIYDNNVFAGSVECNNGSFSLQIDLFNGRNDLIARVYDSLNQRGPDSNKVTVTYKSSVPTGGSRITLTTQYSKRGANPGDILTWPVTVSGGTPPYAISVDWGDKTTPDLISLKAPGNFEIQHTYQLSGVYKVIIKGTDVNHNSAFLQVVAVANGPIAQNNSNGNGSSNLVTVKTKVLLWPIFVLAFLMLVAFWIGRRQQLQAIKNRLRKGETPF